MQEFMEHEEEFEARQSVSSRGRDTRVQMMPAEGRQTETNVNRQTNKGRPTEYHERPTEYQERPTEYVPRNQPHNDYQHDGEGESSSVITEIVDEQVVELESDEEAQFENKGKEDHGINQYLDNIKQEDYVNHDEYHEFEDNKDENSPYRQHEQYKHEKYNQNQEYDDMDDQYEQQQHYNQQQMQYQNNMMENSPIAEHPVEEDLTGSPHYDQRPRTINPKYKRKYEGVDINDKSHLIWEQERIQRKRMEKEMQRVNMWTKPYNFRDIDWHPTMNPKKATFNPEKTAKRSSMWHFSQSSNVPMLSAKSIKASAAEKSLRPKYDPAETLAKRDHTMNNVFHQSSLQNMLNGKNNGKVSAPASHASMSKEVGRAFMTPIDNKYSGHSDVVQGRARMFHSSNVF